jgi:hypothetical protein
VLVSASDRTVSVSFVHFIVFVQCSFTLLKRWTLTTLRIGPPILSTTPPQPLQYNLLLTILPFLFFFFPIPQVFFVSDLFKPKGRSSALPVTPLKNPNNPMADIRERSNHITMA